jgi:hypothetical protein
MSVKYCLPRVAGYFVYVRSQFHELVAYLTTVATMI